MDIKIKKQMLVKLQETPSMRLSKVANVITSLAMAQMALSMISQIDQMISQIDQNDN